MLEYKNKTDKKGNLIPWETSLVHEESKTKLSLRATERSIEKSKILFKMFSMESIEKICNI